MPPIRKNITISETALRQAKELESAGYASTRSGVIQRAVEEAWERRLRATSHTGPEVIERRAPVRVLESGGGASPKKTRRSRR